MSVAVESVGPGLFISRHTGTSSRIEIAALMAQFAEQADQQNIRGLLLDLRAADIRETAGPWLEVIDDLMVATGDPIPIGCLPPDGWPDDQRRAIIERADASDFSFRTFHQEAEAVAWIAATAPAPD
jgi:hypothetical protein